MRLATAVLALALVGCGLVPGLRDQAQDAAGAEPGLIELPPDMQPIGPVTELGRGVGAVNGAWRYEVYPSRIGTCMRVIFVEDGRIGGTGCGGSLRVEPLTAAISLLGYGSATGEGWVIEGIVSDEVAAAWIELEGGERVAADPLMATDVVGGLGRIFYVEIPDGGVPVSAVAADADGEVIGTAPID